MKKKFNISGPCTPNKHYMISPQSRCANIDVLIEEQEYFVLHAARQTGKTTFLIDLVNRLNEQGNCYAIYCSLESVHKIDTPEKGIPAIISSLKDAIDFHPTIVEKKFVQENSSSEYTVLLKRSLNHLCINLNKPVVILFDEVDCLSNGTLISFLRQLRDGYINRSNIPFVSSIGLVGMRNIRDYKAKIREDHETLGSASPFNIVTEVFTLNNFTFQEVNSLLAQHTGQTDQVFSDAVLIKIFDYTQGQPWLVNAVVREIVVNILKSNVTKKIKSAHVDLAVQTIIDRRDTHIDSLLERLKEKRVQKVVEPVIIGEDSGYDPLDDDYQYVIDLGLLKVENYRFKPANLIYEEVMIRTLSLIANRKMAEGNDFNIKLSVEKGKINMKKLLTDFQTFWRENSKIWIERYQYKEAAPHLILMAFLQRILNHGGTISRELASGRGRLDLCVHYNNHRYPIEIKIRRNTKTIAEGKEQLWNYMDTLGCETGWLIVFETRKTISWTKKLFWKNTTIKKKKIHVVGC